MHTNVNIKPAQRNECHALAVIYCKALPKSFLGTLGVPFLSLLFTALIEDKNCVVLSAKINKIIIGFVCGAKNIDEFYSHFYRKNILKLIFILFSKIINPYNFSKILENFLYPNKYNNQLPKAEFLSIALDPKFQGRNIGQKLFGQFNIYMKRLGVEHYKIIVGSSLIQANEYYIKMGCDKVGEIKVHKNELSFIYTYTL